MNILKLRLLSINLFAVMCLGYATDIYAPKPLKTILTEVTGKQWTPSLINTIENRAHVVLMDNSETYCLKVNTLILGDLVVGVSELKWNGYL